MLTLSWTEQSRKAAAHPASIAFPAAHVLIALGLVIGTVTLLPAAPRGGGH
jgi:hypothetical protein